MRFLILTISILVSRLSTGQEVFIGDETNGVKGAILQINSDQKGLLIPRISNVSSVISPGAGSNGLMVYDPAIKDIMIFNEGTGWKQNTPETTGMIVMWTDKNNIPDGWQICDGTNGTPDLQGFFVVGFDSADPDYNAIGPSPLGSDAVTLTTNQLPSHNHVVNDPGHSHTTTANHSHRFPERRLIPTTLTNTASGTPNGGGGATSSSGNTGSTTPTGATFTSTSSSAVTAIGSAGGSQPHENRPSYVVLIFIMKL